MISLDEVKKIASLARLDVTDDEAAKFAVELSAILGFAESLRDLDTSSATVSTHSMERTDVLRVDEIVPCLDRDLALLQAPQAEDGCFIAPKIV